MKNAMGERLCDMCSKTFDEHVGVSDHTFGFAEGEGGIIDQPPCGAETADKLRPYTPPRLRKLDPRCVNSGIRRDTHGDM